MRFFSVGLFQIIKRMHKRYDKQILKNIINFETGGQVVQKQFLASGQHFVEYIRSFVPNRVPFKVETMNAIMLSLENLPRSSFYDYI